MGRSKIILARQIWRWSATGDRQRRPTSIPESIKFALFCAVIDMYLIWFDLIDLIHIRLIWNLTWKSNLRVHSRMPNLALIGEGLGTGAPKVEHAVKQLAVLWWYFTPQGRQYISNYQGDIWRERITIGLSRSPNLALIGEGNVMYRTLKAPNVNI